jgi:glycosyltransferase involved in cell wall biosynthesis
VKVLGIKIQGDYSSEAHVFARLFGHRGSEFDARVIYQVPEGDDNGWRAFEADARTQVVKIDVGYRDRMPNMATKAMALLRFRKNLGRLTALAREYNPDVIYSSQQFWDCAAATYLSQRLKRPHVVHLHYNVGPWLSTGFSRNPRAFRLATIMSRLADPLKRLTTCDQVIAISHFIRQDAIAYGVSPDRIATVHNPVPPPRPIGPDQADVRAALDIPAAARLVGIVGRLDVDKGHLDTLRAFALMAAKNPDAYLLVVGVGPLAESLREEARSLGVSERVRFTGWRNDVPALLRAMDVFVHPSRREPFGLAIAEASAAGLPVIAYAEGGVPEIVVDGETGWLAPPGDVARIADHMIRVLAKPAEAREMGAKGRAHIERSFSPPDASKTLAAVLRRLVRSHGAPAGPDERLRAGHGDGRDPTAMRVSAPTEA